MSVLFHYITYRNQTLGRDYRVLKSSLKKHVLVKITRLLQGSLHLWLSNSVLCMWFAGNHDGGLTLFIQRQLGNTLLCLTGPFSLTTFIFTLLLPLAHFHLLLPLLLTALPLLLWMVRLANGRGSNQMKACQRRYLHWCNDSKERKLDYHTRRLTSH